jgi:sarcosine oxidase gamma subunit
MAEIRDSLSPIEAPGLRIVWDPGLHAASLRYFDPIDVFSRRIQALLGVPLPGVCRAIRAPGLSDTTVLAWRSPTETLLLCDGPAAILQLQALVDSSNDGCVVDQTGGLLALRAQGEGIAELFARMGGHGTLPTPGEARRSRMADVPVLAIQARLGEILLIVERVYAEHLIDWLRLSAADVEVS